MKLNRIFYSVLMSTVVTSSAFADVTSQSAAPASTAAPAPTTIQPAASQPFVASTPATAQPAAPAQQSATVVGTMKPVAQPAPAAPVATASAAPASAPAAQPAAAPAPIMLASAQSASAPASQAAPNQAAPNNAPAAAQPLLQLAQNGVSQTQQKQIEAVVRNYLVNNPEVIVEALQTLQQKQMEQARKSIQKTQENSPKFADVLFHTTNDPIIGNPNGKVTIVEFFDYQCPHCVDMTPVMEALVQANPDVRVVFKEFPIRGQASELATKAALAAKMQGKYFEFHKAIMAVKEQPLTEEGVYKAAATVPGLNVDKLKADMKSDTVNQQIKANYKLAQDLQLIGTPAFFIAKSDVTKNSPVQAIAFVPGQVTKEQLLDIVKKLTQ